MVVLDAFVAVVAIGCGVWFLGSYLGRPDAAFLGAILVVGIAASAMLGDGVMVQTGVTKNTTADPTEISNIYEPVQTAQDFPLDLMVLFVGSVLGFKSLGDMSEQ